MQTRVMRFQIVKPIDIDWKLFGKILFDIQYDTRQVLNKSIQLAWEYQGFSADYKNKFDGYPSAKETLGYSNIYGYAYNQLKTEYTKLNTGNLSQTIKRATDKWKNDKKDILRGDISIPSYKKDCPIDVVKKSIIPYKKGNNYYLKLSLLSNKYKKELNLKYGQIDIMIKVSDNAQKSIIERIINGEYQITASQIVKHKRKWFINLGYNFEAEPIELDEYKVLGIDLGVVNVATMQIYDNQNNKYEWLKYNQCILDGSELIHHRQKIEARKINLQKQSKFAGKGRCGHGYIAKMKPLNKIRKSIANFRDTYNHKISRYIVDFAIRYGCGTIQMEDLAGFPTHQKNKFLDNWSYYDLQQKIEYKANEHGIKVNFIKPQYTSQRCNECGYIHMDNRKTQAEFKCVKCGHKSNADINAAKNIAILGIEQVIDEQLKEQEGDVAV
jgi:putative transposase